MFPPASLSSALPLLISLKPLPPPTPSKPQGAKSSNPNPRPRLLPPTQLLLRPCPLLHTLQLPSQLLAPWVPPRTSPASSPEPPGSSLPQGLRDAVPRSDQRPLLPLLPPLTLGPSLFSARSRVTIAPPDPGVDRAPARLAPYIPQAPVLGRGEGRTRTRPLRHPDPGRRRPRHEAPGKGRSARGRGRSGTGLGVWEMRGQCRTGWFKDPKAV